MGGYLTAFSLLILCVVYVVATFVVCFVTCGCGFVTCFVSLVTFGLWLVLIVLLCLGFDMLVVC